MTGFDVVKFFGAAAVVIGGSLWAVPYVFAGRVVPGVTVGAEQIVGLPDEVVAPALTDYANDLAQQQVTLSFRGTESSSTLGELGVTLNQVATAQAVREHSWRHVVGGQRQVAPVFRINTSTLDAFIRQRFAKTYTPAQNATLTLSSAGNLFTVIGKRGEGVDVVTLQGDLITRAHLNQWQVPITLSIITTAPAIEDDELEPARNYATQLLREGAQLVHQDTQFTMGPSTVRRLLRFVEQVDPTDPRNLILGVTFDSEELTNYLTATIAPDLDQAAVNARFELSEGRVTQFATPQEGRTLDVDQTTQEMAAATMQQTTVFTLVVTVDKPDVDEAADIEALGITTLLAAGESDFVGSPANRVHNIRVGTSKYHGLLIAPNEEFSFNKYLGPVDARGGFKPELVIKGNLTTPEFGGGLCQVSTTAFRAAMHSGLPIIERKNHSYAVRYYGKPGFDATIYPGYTDLRFTNNTPGYILVQTRIAGTKLQFEFWGTDDGREVTVTGPVTYDHEANGAVKAKLTRSVVRNGEVLADDTLYSRYKSPQLYPKVLAADDPQGATQASLPHDPIKPTNPTPNPSPQPRPSPS